MPSPIVTLAFILATLYGASFHLVFGGDARRLALFLLVGWFSFALGHLLGVVFQIDLFNIGTLRVLPASVVSISALLTIVFLTANRSRRRPSR